MFGPQWFALVGVLVFLLSGWLWARSRPRRATKRRNRQAIRGESDAEKLLNRQGFTILQRQVRGRWTMFIDDEPVEVRVRADLLLEKDDQLFIAEVKTGRLAPDPTFPPTRRQLLEYQLAFDTDGIILVDIDEKRIVHVDFPCQRSDD